MNRVHEQCPKSDSRTVLSPKTGSKLGQVHSAPNLAQPARISCAEAARAPTRLPVPTRLCAPRAMPTPCPAPSALSQYTYCIAIQWPNCQPFPGHDTNLYCDPFPFQASLLYCNTVLCIAIQCLTSLTLSCHNTMSFLQYDLGSSPANFCTPNFFFLSFFIIIFFFNSFFFQPLETPKKKYSSIFFFIFHPIHQIIS